MNESPYTEYTLNHWEEPDGPYMRLVAKHGRVSVTPETIHKMIQEFFPVGYQEGEITLDIPVPDFLNYWKALGGAYSEGKKR